MFSNFLDDDYENDLRHLLHDHSHQVPMVSELIFGKSSDDSQSQNIAHTWIWNYEDYSQKEVSPSEESSSISQMIFAREEQEKKIKEFMEMNEQFPKGAKMSRKVSCQTIESIRAKKEKKIKKTAK